MVVVHPCADSFNHAIAARATSALERAGHTVHVLDLYALGVGAAMSPAEREAYHSEQPILDPLLAEHAALVQRAGALVFVYPTWWSSMPAVLKGWLERMMVSGVAFKFNEQHKVRPALTNVRRIVGISTYGAPWRVVKFVNDNGRRILLRALRVNTGFRTRASWLGLYAIDGTTAAQRDAFLAKVERRMGAL